MFTHFELLVSYWYGQFISGHVAPSLLHFNLQSDPLVYPILFFSTIFFKDDLLIFFNAQANCFQISDPSTAFRASSPRWELNYIKLVIKMWRIEKKRVLPDDVCTIDGQYKHNFRTQKKSWRVKENTEGGVKLWDDRVLELFIFDEIYRMIY